MVEKTTVTGNKLQKWNEEDEILQQHIYGSGFIATLRQIGNCSYLKGALTNIKQEA